MALWLLLFPFALMAAVPSVLREYQIKALFLFNFAQFIEWPAAMFSTAEAPLTIGVLGEDPFGADLDEIVRSEKIAGHTLTIRRYRRIEDIDRCHILFISRSENARLEQIFLRLAGRATLTVGDIENFCKRGGMIRFVTENKKIRLRINLQAAQRAGLTISSKLLRPAEIITDGND